MKKNVILKNLFFTFLLGFLLLSLPNVYAASASISASATSVTVGQGVTITVHYNAATWNLHLSGSINDSVVGYDPNGNNVSGSQSWNLNTSSVGTYTVSLSGDVTDGVTDVNSPAGGSVTVTVNPAPAPTPTPTPTPSTPSRPATPSTPAVSPVTGNDNRSANTNLSSLTAGKYSFETSDNLHFNLTVPHSVSSLKLDAKVEDAKAKVNGTGDITLKVGDNDFEVSVTAENGTTKVYYVHIKRKDNKYHLDEIEEALKDTEEVTILLNENDILKKEVLEKIKDSKKVLSFVRYDANNKVLYTWVVDGSKLKNIKDFNTNIVFSFDEVEDFDKVSGYRKGVYLQFGQKNGFPTGVTCQISVDGRYHDNDVINLYSYEKDNKSIKLVEKSMKVKNGMLEFTLPSFSSFFATKALISAETVTENHNIYKIIAIVEFFALFILVCYLAISRKSQKRGVSNSIQG